MSCFNGLKLTKLGEILLANINGNLNETLTFTSGAVGAGAINDENEINSLTALKDKWKDLDILSIEKDEDDETIVKLELQFSNVDLQEAKLFREIGIYAKGNNGEPVLFAYSNAGENYDYVPLPRDNPQTFTIQINLKITSNSKIDAIINMAGFVTIGKMVEFLKNKLTQIPTVIELQSRKNLKVGDIVEVLGYYSAGDGAGHKRIIANEDDGSGVQLANGLWANLITEGNTYDVTHLGFRAVNAASDYVKGNTYDCSVVFNHLRTKGIFVTEQKKNFFLPNKKFYFSEPFFTIKDDIKGDNAKLFFPESDGLSWVIKDNHYYSNDFIIDGLEIESDGNCLAFKEEENTGNYNIYHSIFKNLKLKSLNKSCVFAGYTSRDFQNKGVLTFGNYFENISVGAPNGYGFVGFQSGEGVSNAFTNITDISGKCLAIFYNSCGKISKVNTGFNKPVDFIKIDEKSYINSQMYFDLDRCNAEGCTGYFLTCTNEGVGLKITLRDCSFSPIDNNGIKRDKSPINSVLKFIKLDGELTVSPKVNQFFNPDVAQCPYQVTREYPTNVYAYNQKGAILWKGGYITKDNIVGVETKGALSLLSENLPIYRQLVAQHFVGCVQPASIEVSTTTNAIEMDNHYNTINITSASQEIYYLALKKIFTAKRYFSFMIKNTSSTPIVLRELDYTSGFKLLNSEKRRTLNTNEYSVFVATEAGKNYEIFTTATTSQVSQLNTIYYAEKMKQENVYDDYITYNDEKFAYDKQQKKLEEQRQLAYQEALKENPKLTYEEFMSVQPMTLNLIEEPQPSQALKQFMEKYL